MSELKEITDQNYEKEVMQSDEIWSVTFSALSFCQPCKMLHPVLENIAKNNKIPKIKFGTVATEDKGISWSTSMNVRSVPTTHVIHKGKVLGTIMGFVPEKDFIAQVKEIAKV
tara:strand:- start:1767 stop:2105 length:339 start_codon:yes stop_codon:yes gene_type:complete